MAWEWAGGVSVLVWLAYDPIIAGVETASGADCPLYVDELAGLVRGPRQAMELLFCELQPGTLPACGSTRTIARGHALRWICAASAPFSTPSPS